ncbi:hypothetical protein [Arthrobacter sp. Soil763]|uniref:hypothetical protein n=1 Tax=Arthrobacter sp. Soil763 TaxID=1736402 RepID=UPI0006F7D244|nr:hypothetical protein [Arthrobacter sp. Soil763]KRE79963.1 hypothetical protein ASG71_07975 [Arthrobacter sp. Soil763]
MTAADQYLDTIQARLDAATPGPWWTPSMVTPAEVYSGTGSGDDLCVAEEMKKPDADLIANAPTDLAKLLNAVKAVRELADKRAKKLDETAVRLNQMVLDRDPDRDPDAAVRYNAYANEATAFRKAINATIDAALNAGGTV